MTENEALKRMKMCIGISPSENIVNSFKLISDALEEVQQYREIGTVEEFKTMKENGSFTIEELIQLAVIQMDLKKYKEIGTIEECKQAMERMKPKKAIPNKLLVKGTYIKWNCPNCGETMCSGFYYPPLSFGSVCLNCGQALDWSKGE